MAHTRKSLCLGIAIFASFALTSVVAQAKKSHNKLASNRLSTNRLSTNKLATNRLATNALSANHLEANPDTADILATEDGRDVYSYLISCALPAGVSIQATVPGVADTAPPASNYTCSNEVCTFDGSIGLAEYWIDHKLTPSGQRWVSACVFARVNAHANAEPISLRGPNDSLTVDANEAQQYTVQEGAFYGNLFTGDDPIDWNACRGKDQAAGEFGGLVDRDCAEPDPNDPTGQTTQCGFHYAGDCANFNLGSPSPYACKSFDENSGGYEKCHNGPGDGVWPMLEQFREIITVYVLPN